jgi:carotenoid cleavage dioxygenase-like enzyme
MGDGDRTDRAYELGCRSLDEEVSDRQLPVEGSAPDWLSGALIRNGPGRFEFGGERATHWFDGLAMLRRYGFADGEIRYTNRFLRTDAYEAAETGPTGIKFASGDGPLRTTVRWMKAFGPPEPTDNANVHVARFGDEYVALTEAPRRIAFDPYTLETRGEFRWTDGVAEHLATAHHSIDPDTDAAIGYSTVFGLSPTYHLYRVDPVTAERERFASIDAEGPGYVHDCSITRNYAVLVEPPLRIGLLRALVPWTAGLLDVLEYDETRQTRFLVVDRETGAVVAEPRTDSFFVFHHVNAFEDDDEVVVDLVEFEDDSILEAMTLDALSEDVFATAPSGRLVRYRFGLENGSIERSQRYTGGLELPTVPEAVRGRDYRYAYAQATDRSGAYGLVKVDVESNTATEWWEQGVYVQEPRMVQAPNADREDAGVVLVPALDTGAERSVLLVFDAETLTEQARAPLPHAVPFGFHGRFFPEAAL